MRFSSCQILRIALPVLLALPAAGFAGEPVSAVGGAVIHTESGDAESFPDGSAQGTVGSGPLTRIDGETAGGADFRDAYCIRIVDPAAFRATTDVRVDPEAGSDFDTRLLLFDPSGAPMVANEDSPPSGGPYSSTLTAAASDGSGFALPGPGRYILVVAGYEDDARDALDVDLFELGTAFEAIHAANPAAGAFDHWTDPGIHFGTYSIALRSAMPCNPTTVVPQGEELQVNTYTTRFQNDPSVAMSSQGDFVVVWNSLGSSFSDNSYTSIQGQRFASNGDPLGSEFQVNSYTIDPQYQPAVAMSGQGRLVVVWRTYWADQWESRIRGQLYDASGAPLGSELQVSSNTTSAHVYAPAVAMDPQGNFVVAWHSNGSNGDDTSYASIQGQRFASSGAPLGSQFQVNTYTSSNQRYPSTAIDGQGNFVVVWASYGSDGTDNSGWSIQGQRFASNGDALGSEFQINTFTSNHQLPPSAAMDSQGNFVVIWGSDGSYGTDTSLFSVQGQRFASNGDALGSEFQVNSYTSNQQSPYSVAMNSEGDFIVVWRSEESSGNDNSGRSIQAQRFASNGDAIGSEFQVNSYTTNAQYQPAAAMSSQGNFVVVWASDGSAGTDSDSRSVHSQLWGVDSDGDGIADPGDGCPDNPDSSCIRLDGFESGQTFFWSGAAP